MQQGSILPFLQKGKPARPGQPYYSRPNTNGSRGNSSQPSGQHRGPNRRRNEDLKKIADETKEELPKVLASLPGFEASQSSIHDLKNLDTLDPNDCPGFVLASEDEYAGHAGTRIRVWDMDTFDAALRLDPTYTVSTHLELSSTADTWSSSNDPSKDDEMVDYDMQHVKSVTERIQAEQHTRGREENDTTANTEVDTQHHNPSSAVAELTTPQSNPTDLDENSKGKSISQPATSPHLPTTTTTKSLPPKPVLVLNLASERSPGGGWQNGALAQEECLCYRSSLYLSLHKSYYRLPSLSAIYTSSVLLIRSSMSAGHTLLVPGTPVTQLPVVAVVSAAALRHPPLTDDKKHFANLGLRAETKRKMRVVLRVAALGGHTKLVLGALGCGVFGNPPREVAECFLEVLREKEFQGGWWEEVAFAVLDNVKGPEGGKDGKGNFGAFYRVLDGQVV